jgi:hypothetical protein
VGSFNTAVGRQALFRNTSFYNTAIGEEALYNNTNGGNNIAIGYQAGILLTTGVNNIAIGHDGVAGESNTIRIGRGQHTSTNIAGVFAGGLLQNGNAVYCDANGHFYSLASSRRFKDEIQDMDDASSALLQFRPVTFRYKSEQNPNRTPQFGLIAEEVAEINPDLVVRDSSGEINSVRYEAVNAMLLNEFLKDHRRVADLQTENAAMKKRVAELEANDAAMKKQFAEWQARDKEREARLSRLEQFVPAPEASAARVTLK